MALASAILGVGCGASSEFTCQADVQCVGDGAGVCQPDGYCSFPAADCPSGQRYGEHSGSSSGACVGLDQDTEVAQTGPTSTSTGGPASESSGGLLTGEPTTSGDASGGETITGEPVDPDLVLWLELEPAPEGEVPDSSSFMTPGTCKPPACPEVGPGAVGQGVQLDGDDDVIVVPHSPQLETGEGFTVAAWVLLFEAPIGHRALLTKPLGEVGGNTWELYFYEEVLYLGMQSNGVFFEAVLPGPFAIDEWIHVAGTWNGAELTLWVAGQPVDSTEVLSIEFDDHPVMVGADDDHEVALVGHFAGGIDDARVYRRALTPDELAQLAGG